MVTIVFNIVVFLVEIAWKKLTSMPSIKLMMLGILRMDNDALYSSTRFFSLILSFKYNPNNESHCYGCDIYGNAICFFFIIILSKFNLRSFI